MGNSLKTIHMNNPSPTPSPQPRFLWNNKSMVTLFSHVRTEQKVPFIPGTSVRSRSAAVTRCRTAFDLAWVHCVVHAVSCPQVGQGGREPSQNWEGLGLGDPSYRNAESQSTSSAPDIMRGESVKIWVNEPFSAPRRKKRCNKGF